MVKVLDPDGVIIGVYEKREDVPERLPNRFHTYVYPTEDLDIVEVTDPRDQQRLLPSLRKAGKDE